MKVSPGWRVQSTMRASGKEEWRSRRSSGSCPASCPRARSRSRHEISGRCRCRVGQLPHTFAAPCAARLCSISRQGPVAAQLRGDIGHGLDLAGIAHLAMGGEDLRHQRRAGARQADDEDMPLRGIAVEPATSRAMRSCVRSAAARADPRSKSLGSRRRLTAVSWPPEWSRRPRHSGRSSPASCPCAAAGRCVARARSSAACRVSLDQCEDSEVSIGLADLRQQHDVAAAEGRGCRVLARISRFRLLRAAEREQAFDMSRWMAGGACAGAAASALLEGCERLLAPPDPEGNDADAPVHHGVCGRDGAGALILRAASATRPMASRHWP